MREAAEEVQLHDDLQRRLQRHFYGSGTAIFNGPFSGTVTFNGTGTAVFNGPASTD